MGIRQERSVDNLQELYTVAVGVSLALAMEHLVQDKGFPIQTGELPAFVSFLATLIPFYHGAMRHLDQTYGERGGRHMRRGSLLADFLMLFVEACFFLALAQLLARPGAVAWTVASLWAFDAVWGGAVYLLMTKTRHPWGGIRWVVINLIAAPSFVLFLIFEHPGLGARPSDRALGVALLAFPIVRSVVDYAESWDFYFPPRRERSDPEPRAASPDSAPRLEAAE